MLAPCALCLYIYLHIYIYLYTYIYAPFHPLSLPLSLRPLSSLFFPFPFFSLSLSFFFLSLSHTRTHRGCLDTGICARGVLKQRRRCGKHVRGRAAHTWGRSCRGCTRCVREREREREREQEKVCVYTFEGVPHADRGGVVEAVRGVHAKKSPVK